MVCSVLLVEESHIQTIASQGDVMSSFEIFKVKYVGSPISWIEHLSTCTNICENYYRPLVIKSDFCKSKSFWPPNLKLYENTELSDNVFLVSGCFFYKAVNDDAKDI